MLFLFLSLFFFVFLHSSSLYFFFYSLRCLYFHPSYILFTLNKTKAHFFRISLKEKIRIKERDF